MKKVAIPVVCFVVLVVLFGLFYEVRQLYGKSMEPAVMDRSSALYKKISSPAQLLRGDIVLYRNGMQMGRVIALPGEQVFIKDGVFYLDIRGEKYLLREEYVVEKSLIKEINEWIKIPNNKYLILSDKRNETTIVNNIIDGNDIQLILVTQF